MRSRPSGGISLPVVLSVAALIASTAQATEMVWNCYLLQSGSGTAARFIRRLDIDSSVGSVAIADDYGRTGFRPLSAYGNLVSADAGSIVFDFRSARSSGRTTINRKTGAYYFTDGRVVARGTCVPSEF